MNRKNSFDLTEALWRLFQKSESQEEFLKKREILENILRETGLTPDELDLIVRESAGGNIGNLKYRILNIMDKANRDSSHII